MSRSPHDEFLELCAISTSGQLTGEEQKRLQKHLAVCPSCREAMKQYEAVVSETFSALVPDPEGIESDSSWSQEQAEAALFKRLTSEEELDATRQGGDRDSASWFIGINSLWASQTTLRNVWTLCGAGVVLCVALGISAYRLGARHAPHSASAVPTRDQSKETALEQQLSDAGHEREVLRAEMAKRDRVIVDLRRQLEEQSANLGQVKLAQSQLETDLQNGQAGRQGLLQERSDLSQKLEVTQAKAQGLEDKLDSLELQSSEDKQRATVLEAKVTDLTRLLQDRETTVDQQQQLLAHDRDIRDLIGARDLYIAEVFDVAKTGTQKPYGRVFYTKGKSLIFYAYDLDRQTEAKSSNTFQAWGQRGPDREQAINLGVFYQDSESKKRWILRFDDPKTLDQIDAVFVTVEPNGGSNKPSTKRLLFASLRIDPNHP